MSDGATQDAVLRWRRLAGELAEFASLAPEPTGDAHAEDEPLAPSDVLLDEFDRRIRDDDLRAATRSRFVSKHYADAVEAGVKALNETVRGRTGSEEDGDALMTLAFSQQSPILRINKGKSKSDLSEQRGFMQLCQGVVAAWRNPRAHSLIDDSPHRALMMLETIDDLIATTRAATRTRKKKAI